VIETSSQNLLGLNQQTYVRLKLALSLSLRRQIFIAVCDDLPLRDRLASRLQQDLIQTTASPSERTATTGQTPEYPRLVTLKLDLQSPNPVVQIAQWLSFNPPPRSSKRRFSVPAFQFLGIEQLTRQPATVQRQFLTHLQGIERSLPVLDSSLLFWMPRPWFRTLPQSAQEFWRCRTAIFEFIGEPRPLALEEESLPHPLESMPFQEPNSTEPFDEPSEDSPPPPSRPSANLWTILKQDLAQLDVGSPPVEPDAPEEYSAHHSAVLTTLRREEEAPTAAKTVPMTIVALTPSDRDNSGTRTESTTLKEKPPQNGTGDRPHPPSPTDKAHQNGTGDRPHLPIPVDKAAQNGTTHRPHAPIPVDKTHQNAGDRPQPTVPIDKAEQNGTILHPHPAIPAEPSQQNGHADHASVMAPPLEESANGHSLLPTDLLDVFLGDRDSDRPPLPSENGVVNGQSYTADLELAEPELEVWPAELEDLDPVPPALVEEESLDLDAAQDSDIWPANLKDLDAATEIDRQIALFRDYIEQLHRQNASPSLLADTYRTLGDIYRDRIEQGEATPANLRGGIQSYEQVLVWLSETSPLWPDVLNDLGNLHWMLSRQEGDVTAAEAHLQQAIQHYELGLARLDADLLPQNIAMIQNNLGAAYTDLARYCDAGANLQRSIACYQQVLQYRTPQKDPVRYASTQNNLGTAYWNLAQQERPRHYLKEAIAAYGEALEYCTSEDDPTSFGMIHNNLGTAYWNLAQFERPQHWLQRAIESYQLALKYRTPQASLTAYAATQNNLGTAYWHLASQLEDAPQRLDTWQKAIQAYDTALHAVAQLPAHTHLSFDLYASHANLGLAHYQMATDTQLRVESEACGRHLELALEHHVHALQGWEDKPQLRQTALGHIIKTMRALYRHGGLAGQNLALSMVPANLLPEILPRL